MHPILDDGCLQAPGPLLSCDPQTLLEQARALRSTARDGTLQQPLRGKRLGLLCEHEEDPDAELFRRAARELGADVAHVRLPLPSLDSAPHVEHTARVLGRLYDALECQGMPHGLVERIRQHVNVPVYDGLACASHRIAGLARQLDAPPEDARRYVLQAALLASLV
jgi:ornithine carbamoyltransferase